MKKLITATLVGGAIIGSLLGAGTASATDRPVLTDQEEYMLPGLSVTVCSTLDVGNYTPEDLVVQLAPAVGSVAGATRIVLASMYDYCPEHLS